MFSGGFVYQIHELLCGFARLRKYHTVGAESIPVASRTSNEKEKRKTPISDYPNVPSFSLEFRVCDVISLLRVMRKGFFLITGFLLAEQKRKQKIAMVCSVNLLRVVSSYGLKIHGLAHFSESCIY